MIKNAEIRFDTMIEGVKRCHWRSVLVYTSGTVDTKSSSREELIRIQKRVAERLKREIELSLKKPSQELIRYRQEYENEFRSFKRITSMDELIEAARQADIIYNGDYHPMAQAQRIPLRILRELIKYRPRITLALEMVLAHHQPILDKFMADEISEPEFLKAIEYQKTWGFPWQNYRNLFIFAKDNNMEVIGINSQGHRGKGALKKRDLVAARIIANQYIRDPGRLIYVFDGDLHVSPTHLPAATEEILNAHGHNPKSLIIYQNNERIYWELADRNLEQDAEVVLIDDNKFCVMSTPPIIKYQSYLNWIENTNELSSPYPRSWGPFWTGSCDLYDQMLDLASLIAEFLEIDQEGIDDFVVYSPADLNFLEDLRTNYRLSLEEIRTIAEHIGNNESYFIEKANVIYVANLSVNHAAEEITHFIHKLCAGPRGENLSQVEDFYCRIMREALGFFGSKIINHKRPCYTLQDFLEAPTRHPSKPPEQIADMITIGKWIAKHKSYEAEYLKTGRRWKLSGKMFSLPLRIHLGVTHALGYMLGEKLFEAIVRGEIRKQYVRSLFYTNFSDLDESLDTYLYLLRRLKSF